MVATLEQVFREEWGRVLATLIGFLGDFDLAEEAAQEAFAMAADRWPRDGVPSNPRAWLMRTARNRATDRIRRDVALATKFGLLAAGDRAEVPMNTTTFPDERLELIFTCCHPALAVEAQVKPSTPPALSTSPDSGTIPPHTPGRIYGVTLLACSLTCMFALCFEAGLFPGGFPHVVAGCGAAVA